MRLARVGAHRRRPRGTLAGRAPRHKGCNTRLTLRVRRRSSWSCATAAAWSRAVPYPRSTSAAHRPFGDQRVLPDRSSPAAQPQSVAWSTETGPSSSDQLVRHNRVHCVPLDTQEVPAVAKICQRTVAVLAQLRARRPGRPRLEGGRRPGCSKRGRDCRHGGRPRTTPSAPRAALTREVAGARRNLAGGRVDPLGGDVRRGAGVEALMTPA